MTLLAQLTSYLAIDSTKISVVVDPITSNATVSVSFDSVAEGTTIARALNSQAIASSVSGTLFDEPAFREVEVGEAKQDVHLKYPGGGSADYRGAVGTLYNLVSTPDVSVNMGVAESTFRLKNATVEGTFIDRIHVRTRDDVFASLYANSTARVQCNRRTIVLPPHTNLTCGSTVVTRRMVSYEFVTAHWWFRVLPLPVYGHERGASRRIDVMLSKRREGQEAHGLLGQGFNGIALDGRKDVYPTSGRFRTVAWAQGAIQGRPEDYVVNEAHDSSFRFTKFSA